MSGTALLFGIVCITLTGAVFGGFVVQMINDAKEIRRIKAENRRYARGDISQIDFIHLMAEYEAGQRAARNREAVAAAWVEDCRRQQEEDMERKNREKQKRQVKDQLAKANKKKEEKA